MIFINVAKIEASFCLLFKEYVAKSQYADELWCRIHFSKKTNCTFVFGNYSEILIYGSELFFQVFWKMVNTSKLIKNTDLLICILPFLNVLGH